LRRHLPALQIAVPFATASLVVVACGSGGSSTARSAKAIGSTAAASAPAPGTPPPAPGDGGAGASSPTYTATGKYTLAGATAFKANATISASGSDESGVLVIKSATLTLMNSKITTSGNSKSSEESSFYGLNAGVLANTKGKAYISGGSVTTSGSGVNGIFAYGAGAVISTADTAITATGGGAHGAMTAGGGAATLAGANISTAGASAAAIATDRGGGTISVSGGTMTTSGYKSPAIYSTGVIKISGARMSATGAEAAVVEGGNSIAVTDTTLKAARQHGVMLYNSMSGDANAGTGTFTMDGGSLTAAAGPAFYVTNTKAVIALRGGARVSAASGTLVRADNKGTGSGNTGTGAVTLARPRDAHRQPADGRRRDHRGQPPARHDPDRRDQQGSGDARLDEHLEGDRQLCTYQPVRSERNHRHLHHEHHRPRVHRDLQRQPRSQQQTREQDLRPRRRRPAQASLTQDRMRQTTAPATEILACRSRRSETAVGRATSPRAAGSRGDRLGQSGAL
jgi:hypothetical protein